MEVRFKVAASTFKVGTGGMTFGRFRHAGAAVVGRTENNRSRSMSALVAGMAQHREAHRSGEHQQGQKATEQPMSKRTFHNANIRSN